MCEQCDAEIAPLVHAQLQQLEINLELSGLPQVIGFGIMCQALSMWRRAHLDKLHPVTNKPMTDGEFLDLFLSNTLEIMKRHDAAEAKKVSALGAGSWKIPR